MNEYKRLEGTRQNGVIFSHHQYSSSLYPHLSHTIKSVIFTSLHLHQKHHIISHHSQWPPSLDLLSLSPLLTPSKPHTKPQTHTIYVLTPHQKGPPCCRSRRKFRHRRQLRELPARHHIGQIRPLLLKVQHPRE